VQERYNQDTQPLPRYRLFANWEAVSKGWFVLCRSRELRARQARSFVVCGHKVVAYRGRSGRAHALDAYCPHMGLDLGQGTVVGENLRCAFHHWVFDAEGNLAGRPQGAAGGRADCLQAYATWEGYGLVWIYPDREAPAPPYLPPELEGLDVVGSLMAPQKRTCHPHAATSNGVDIHHIKAVHGIHVDLSYEVRRLAPNVIRYDLGGAIPATTWGGRLARALMGPEYGYSVTYVDGTLGIFHSLRGVRFLGRFPAPEAFMILAPRWTEVGEVEVFPVALAARRRGLLGWLRTWWMLVVAKLIYFSVVAGEGTEFFRHLRYRVDRLEPGIDDPVATLVEFFEDQEVSMWSTPSEDEGSRSC
jgi:nitrite reductase/ring-hydroxylating ferredoxin subunit